MNKPELLAPAGSFEKAKVAFLYGADAVYCGTSSLSLRTRADMGNDDLVKTIKYAHSIGKRVHVTLNIFAWDDKYEEIIINEEDDKSILLFNTKTDNYEDFLRFIFNYYKNLGLPYLTWLFENKKED